MHAPEITEAMLADLGEAAQRLDQPIIRDPEMVLANLFWIALANGAGEGTARRYAALIDVV